MFWGISNEILIGPDNEPLRKNLRDLAKLALNEALTQIKK